MYDRNGDISRQWLSFAKHCSCATLLRVDREGTAIDPTAMQRNEHVTRRHTARIDGQSLPLDATRVKSCNDILRRRGH
jgi:hypothetical protein